MTLLLLLVMMVVVLVMMMMAIEVHMAGEYTIPSSFTLDPNLGSLLPSDMS